MSNFFFIQPKKYIVKELCLSSLRNVLFGQSQENRLEMFPITNTYSKKASIPGVSSASCRAKTYSLGSRLVKTSKGAPSFAMDAVEERGTWEQVLHSKFSAKTRRFINVPETEF